MYELGFDRNLPSLRDRIIRPAGPKEFFDKPLIEFKPDNQPLSVDTKSYPLFDSSTFDDSKVTFGCLGLMDEDSLTKIANDIVNEGLNFDNMLVDRAHFSGKTGAKFSLTILKPVHGKINSELVSHLEGVSLRCDSHAFVVSHIKMLERRINSNFLVFRSMCFNPSNDEGDSIIENDTLDFIREKLNIVMKREYLTIENEGSAFYHYVEPILVDYNDSKVPSIPIDGYIGMRFHQLHEVTGWDENNNWVQKYTTKLGRSCVGFTNHHALPYFNQDIKLCFEENFCVSKAKFNTDCE